MSLKGVVCVQYSNSDSNVCVCVCIFLSSSLWNVKSIRRVFGKASGPLPMLSVARDPYPSKKSYLHACAPLIAAPTRCAFVSVSA